MRRILLRIVASLLLIAGVVAIISSGQTPLGDLALTLFLTGTVGILSGVGLWLVRG